MKDQNVHPDSDPKSLCFVQDLKLPAKQKQGLHENLRQFVYFIKHNYWIGSFAGFDCINKFTEVHLCMCDDDPLFLLHHAFHQEKNENICVPKPWQFDCPTEVFPVPGGPTNKTIDPAKSPLIIPTDINSKILSLTSLSP